MYAGERELGTLLQQWIAKADEGNEFPVDLLKDFESEFLFELFCLLVLGGQFNQWDQSVTPYREMIKQVYKEIVK